jgi:hypothetical protein
MDLYFNTRTLVLTYTHAGITYSVRLVMHPSPCTSPCRWFHQPIFLAYSLARSSSSHEHTSTKAPVSDWVLQCALDACCLVAPVSLISLLICMLWVSLVSPV